MGAWTGAATLTWTRTGEVTGTIRYRFTVEPPRPLPCRTRELSERDARRILTLDLMCQQAAYRFGVPPNRVHIDLSDGDETGEVTDARWWEGRFRYGSGILRVNDPEPGARLVDLVEV